MVDFVRKLKPEPKAQEAPRAEVHAVDMSPVVDAINEQTLVLAEAIQARMEQKQPTKQWVFSIVRDSAGDLKQVIAECKDT